MRNIREHPAIRVETGQDAFEPDRGSSQLKRASRLWTSAFTSTPGGSTSWPGCLAGETSGTGRRPGVCPKPGRSSPSVRHPRRMSRRNARCHRGDARTPSSHCPDRPTDTGGEWAGEVVPLEPVDSVSITTVCDNSIDFWLLDEGPARRLLSRRGEPPTVDAIILEGGRAIDSPTAEPGFSAHIEITKGGRTHRLLFDAGVTPTGCRENLARLDLSPRELEAVVCSHGHFDHTTGISGLLDVLGSANMPIVIHRSSGAAGGSPSPVESPWSSPQQAAGPSKTAASRSSRTASHRSFSRIRCS